MQVVPNPVRVAVFQGKETIQEKAHILMGDPFLVLVVSDVGDRVTVPWEIEHAGVLVDQIPDHQRRYISVDDRLAPFHLALDDGAGAGHVHELDQIAQEPPACQDHRLERGLVHQFVVDAPQHHLFHFIEVVRSRIPITVGQGNQRDKNGLVIHVAHPDETGVVEGGQGHGEQDLGAGQCEQPGTLQEDILRHGIFQLVQVVDDDQDFFFGLFPHVGAGLGQAVLQLVHAMPQCLARRGPVFGFHGKPEKKGIDIDFLIELKFVFPVVYQLLETGEEFFLLGLIRYRFDDLAIGGQQDIHRLHVHHIQDLPGGEVDQMVAGAQFLGDLVEEGGFAAAAMTDEEQFLIAPRGMDGGDERLHEGLEEIADEEFLQRLSFQGPGLEMIGDFGKGRIQGRCHGFSLWHVMSGTEGNILALRAKAERG